MRPQRQATKEEKTRFVTIEMQVGLPLPEYFTCQICQEIVEDATICDQNYGGCEAAFCQVCIDSHQEQNETCPICNALFYGASMPPQYTDMLNMKEFRCEECQEPFTYADRFAHTNILCGSLNYNCPMKCSFTANFKAVMDLRVHMVFCCPVVTP